MSLGGFSDRSIDNAALRAARKPPAAPATLPRSPAPRAKPVAAATTATAAAAARTLPASPTPAAAAAAPAKVAAASPAAAAATSPAATATAAAAAQTLLQPAPRPTPVPPGPGPAVPVAAAAPAPRASAAPPPQPLQQTLPQPSPRAKPPQHEKESKEKQAAVRFAPIPADIQSLISGWVSGGALEEMTTKERIDRVQVECYDREEEIEMIANQISCAHKNCVIVSAKPGMGKTTMMNHIARLVMEGRAPKGFQNRRIFLITNPKKALEIFQAVDKWFGKHCVLFCDEVHQIFAEDRAKQSLGGGSSSSEAEGLKPYIGDGRVKLVGFTDRAHGQGYGDPGFLGDLAWLRRFWEVTLPDMSIEAAIKVMQRARPTLQRKFQEELGMSLEITDDALEVAVRLADWLYPKQQFPDKTSHVLEPACANKMRAAQNGAKVTITREDIISFIQHKRKRALKEIVQGLAEVELRAKMKYIPADSPLMEYCRDLSMQAVTGELQPAYGREKILKQLIRTLSAGTCNNAILYGPAGCGKTRIAYGMACLIASGKVPDHLKGRHVLLLDLAAFVGGTQLRGQLEEKVAALLRSAELHLGKYILFIDEFHCIMGAGAHMHAPSSGVSDHFKTALSDGRLPTVGMTNLPDLVRSDDALARRFHFYEVPLFSPAETTDCMMKQRAHTEQYYSQILERPFRIDDEAIKIAVALGQTIPGENLPASALKLLDRACGTVAAEAHEAEEAKEEKAKAAGGAAHVGQQAEVKEGDAVCVVKRGHVEAVVKEALGNAPKAQPVVIPEQGQKELSARITRNFMEQLPPGVSGYVEPAAKLAVERAVQRALSAPEPAEVVPGEAVPVVLPSPRSLVDRVIRDQSCCIRFGLWICNIMSVIAEFFKKIFCCGASRSAAAAA